MSRKPMGHKAASIRDAGKFPLTVRGQFQQSNEELLSHYPHSDAELVADLFEVRAFVLKGDYSRYVHIMANFYDAEPKVGWQDQARRIVVRAREVAP
jgi:hypothetical protein